MSERAMLMQLVETADSVEPDWEDALRRAGYLARRLPRRRELLRPRRVLVLLAAVLAVIYALSAVAADRRPIGLVHQLIDRSDETYPVRQVPELGEWVLRERSATDFVRSQKEPPIRAVPVLRGSIAGHRFEMSTWSSDDLYYGFSPGGPAEPVHGTDVPAVGAGWGRIDRLQPGDGESQHWVSITATVGGMLRKTDAGYVGQGPKWLFGIANPRVARVDLENENDGTVVSVPTFAGPDQSPVPVRLWVAALRRDQLVHNVVPRNKDGEALEHWRLQTAM